MQVRRRTRGRLLSLGLQTGSPRSEASMSTRLVCITVSCMTQMSKTRFASDDNASSVTLISMKRPNGGTLMGTIEVEVSLHVRTYGTLPICVRTFKRPTQHLIRHGSSIPQA